MIIIDGRQTDMQPGNFANLEEILVNVLNDATMQQRVVTDVLVNDEAFSEIYPHQAEDIDSSSIKSVEVRSVPLDEMALNIVGELGKVVQMMANGSRQVARLFRQSEEANALELFQDLLDVTRDFLGMLHTLRQEFTPVDNEEFSSNVEQLSNLLSEMSEVLAGEDWVLLADLLEYEFQPACESWKKVIQEVRVGIAPVTRQ